MVLEVSCWVWGSLYLGTISLWLPKPLRGWFWDAITVYCDAINGLGIGNFIPITAFFAGWINLRGLLPWGTASNVIAFLANANVALSVAMTTCSTFGAILLTPFLTASLSGSYLDVDAWGLFYSTLKVVLVPVALGVLLKSICQSPDAKNFALCTTTAVVLIVLIVASIIGQGKEIILSSGLNLIAAIMLLHFLVSY